MRLIRALRDCKQRSLTVSKKSSNCEEKSFPQFLYVPIFGKGMRRSTFQLVKKKGGSVKRGEAIQWMRGLVRISKGKAIQWRGPGHAVNRRTLKTEKFLSSSPSRKSAPKIPLCLLVFLFPSGEFHAWLVRAVFAANSERVPGKFRVPWWQPAFLWRHPALPERGAA